MYTNILIATDGSELAGNAVQHGIDLAMRIGAKVTVLTVSPPFHVFTTNTQMIEDTAAQYQVRMNQYADKILSSVAHLAQAAGVVCETVHVEHEHPYQAIINTAASRGCDLIDGLTRPPWHICDCPRQRDGQSTHTFQDPGTRPSLSCGGARPSATLMV
jgi:nucleotide-binding universal stress UspA family protein